jgi:hypothetical protein
MEDINSFPSLELSAYNPDRFCLKLQRVPSYLYGILIKMLWEFLHCTDGDEGDGDDGDGWW